MRILHLHLSREFAGSETYAASLASLQAHTGHEVRIIVRNSSYLGRWQRESGGAKVLVLPRWALGPLAKWVAMRYAIGFGPEILHSHLGRAHKLATWLAVRLHVPHVGTIHLRFKAKEHAHCDGLIAVAKWQLQEIPASFQGKVAVIWNWLPAQYRKLARSAHQSTRPEVFTFGSVGRLHPQKGMLTLVKAFQSAFPNNNKVRLQIIGEGPERQALEQLIGTDARIQLLGYQTDLAPFYASWSAYVSAAKHEPFGLTILEAMAHQLPLICTRTEGPSNYLATQPHTPQWAEIDNVESLATALQRCYAAGHQSVQWAMAPFDGNRAQAQIENLYKELCS